MAEITKARTGHLIRKLFGILQARPDGMKVAEALAALVAQRTPLWTRNYGQLDDSARRRLPLKPVWFLAGQD